MRSTRSSPSFSALAASGGHSEILRVVRLPLFAGNLEDGGWPEASTLLVVLISDGIFRVNEVFTRSSSRFFLLSSSTVSTLGIVLNNT